MSTTLKEILELANNKTKEKLADEKHKLGSCPENKFFQEYNILGKEEEK